MAPTLTTTARVRLRPPKPPPRLVEPPRTTSNGHKVPGVVAAAKLTLATLRAGDALYIPDGWWHLVRSHGRNVAVAVEFEPFDRDGSFSSQ